MKIALDYDGTVTESFELWAQFVRLFHDQGHDVRIVTFRSSDEYTDDMFMFQLMTEDLKGWRIPIIFTERIAKYEFCRAKGISFDIWIDDEPGAIDKPFESWSEQRLQQWKETLPDRVAAKREHPGGGRATALNIA